MLGMLRDLIGIGRVTLADDSGEVQLLQVTEGATGTGGDTRVLDKVRRVSEFGFASVPPINSEALMLRRLASRALSIVIGTSHRPSRPTGLQPGDTVLYDVRGIQVSLTASGVSVNAQGLEVLVTNASKVRCECDIETTGDVRCRVNGTAVSLGALHDAYDAHKHTGVQAGSASSGPTDTPA